jgi:hypothetical protein
MKYITQTLACLSFIFALQAPCNARHSAKRTRTILYSIVGGVIVIAAATLGSSSLYASSKSSSSNQTKRVILTDEDPRQLSTDRQPRRTPRHKHDNSLYMSPLSTPRHPITPESALSLLTPEALQKIAPKMTPTQTGLYHTPKRDRSHDSRAIVYVNSPSKTPESPQHELLLSSSTSSGSSLAYSPYTPSDCTTPAKSIYSRPPRTPISLRKKGLNTHGKTAYIDAGVLVPEQKKYGGRGMPAAHVGATPNKRLREIPRTRVDPKLIKQLLEKSPKRKQP